MSGRNYLRGLLGGPADDKDERGTTMSQPDDSGTIGGLVNLITPTDYHWVLQAHAQDIVLRTNKYQLYFPIK